MIVTVFSIRELEQGFRELVSPIGTPYSLHSDSLAKKPSRRVFAWRVKTRQERLTTCDLSSDRLCLPSVQMARTSGLYRHARPELTNRPLQSNQMARCDERHNFLLVTRSTCIRRVSLCGQSPPKARP